MMGLIGENRALSGIRFEIEVVTLHGSLSGQVFNHSLMTLFLGLQDTPVTESESGYSEFPIAAQITSCHAS